MLVFFIILIGSILRIYKLGYHDLWFDEACSALYTQHQSFIAKDLQAPLHTWLLIGWVRATGLEEFWLRLPAFLFGSLSIILVYLIGKMLFDKKISLCAAFFLSISPLHIWYSQEARAYTQSVFLIILSVYFFILAIKKNRLFFWICLSLTQIGGLYTNYVFALLFFPQAVIIVSMARKHIKRWFLCWCIGLLTLAPWLNHVFKYLIFTLKDFWISKPNLFSLYATFANFNLGYTAFSAGYFISSILFLILLISGIRNGLKKYNESTLMVILFTFIPLITAFLISQWKSLYLSRQLMLFLPFYLLLVSLGIASIRRKIFKVTIVIVLLYLTGISLINYYQNKMPCPIEYHLGAYTKKPVRPAINFIRNNYQKDDVLAFTNTELEAIFWHYLKGQYPRYYFIIPDAQDRYWRKFLLAYNRYAIDLTRQEIRYNGRIWLVSGDWGRDEKLDSNSAAVREWLHKHYALINETWIDGILIGLYK